MVGGVDPAADALEVGRGDAGGRGDVLVLVAPGAVGQLGRPGPVPGVDAGEAEADQRRRLQVGVQVGPEQAQVGQAQGAEQDRVAGVDVDPVGGVLAGGHGQGLDGGAGRLVEPGLGPVLVDGGMALRGRLGRRRGGHGERPQQGRGGDDDTHELAQGRSLPGRLHSLAVSAGTGDRARGGVKETGEAVEPSCMRIDDQPAGGGATSTAGTGGAAGASRWGGRGSGRPDPPGSATVGCCWSWSPWPRSSPWSTSRRSWATAGACRASSRACRRRRASPRSRPPSASPRRPRRSGDARPATAARAHPNRQHPRPAGASEPLRGDVETRAARNRGGSGPGGPGCGWVGVAGRVPAAGDDAAGGMARRPACGCRRSRSGSGPRRSSAATCPRCGWRRPRWNSTRPSPSVYHPTGW